MNRQIMFSQLVDNALDFLNSSLEEIESKPKYSVIHFYAGIELMLKARLMAEHWSLVIARKHEPDLRKFESGDFVSVSLDEAADRLEKVVNSGLRKEELEAFKNLGKHRNRMVHFFHEVDTDDAEEELLLSIAREYFKSWYFVHRVLQRWSRVFQPWDQKFNEFSLKLKKLHGYLEAVFDVKRPEIKKRQSEGDIFSLCPSCEFESHYVGDELGSLFETDCLICGFSGKCLTVECPKCGELVTFIDEGRVTCPGCEAKLEPEDLVELLSKDSKCSKEDYEKGLPAHCSNCDGYETVVESLGNLFCTNCFEEFGEVDLNECEYCGSLNTGDMSDSSLCGCTVCEGSWGNVKDD
jgi:hypothetical protein